MTMGVTPAGGPYVGGTPVTIQGLNYLDFGLATCLFAATDEHGHTPLELAVHLGHEEITRVLTSMLTSAWRRRGTAKEEL